MVIIMQPISALLTPKEMCLISALHKLLGDFDPECIIYQDMALLCYLQFAIDDINAHPTRTSFTLDTWPKNWDALLLQGAQLNALVAQNLFEQGKEFEINDQGVVINPPPISANLREIHSTLLQVYETRKEKIKADYRPHGGAAIGSTVTAGYGVTRLLSQRHLREGRIF